MRRLWWLLAILLISGAEAAPAAAAGAQVLQLSPDDLRSYAAKRELLVTARDPFNWPPEEQKQLKAAARSETPDFLSGISLTGIMWDEKMPLAVINGGMHGVGDTVAGARISAIFKETVVLDYNGSSYTLWIQKGSPKPTRGAK
ncbi:MAG: hypothetical protein M0017_06665 [Desulfobacteraceae bacterium]|nr:hypothetical protein [Desulfobacteraceae bacterium]